MVKKDLECKKINFYHWFNLSCLKVTSELPRKCEICGSDSGECHDLCLTICDAMQSGSKVPTKSIGSSRCF